MNADFQLFYDSCLKEQSRWGRGKVSWGLANLQHLWMGLYLSISLFSSTLPCVFFSIPTPGAAVHFLGKEKREGCAGTSECDCLDCGVGRVLQPLPCYFFFLSKQGFLCKMGHWKAPQRLSRVVTSAGALGDVSIPLTYGGDLCSFDQIWFLQSA